MIRNNKAYSEPELANIEQLHLFNTVYLAPKAKAASPEKDS